MKLIRNLLLVFLAFLSLAMVTTLVNAQTQAETVKNNVKATVEYPLPYPGILPDNVLYPLKTLRDRAIEFLTIDPLKKAEFYLLQADKRLAASRALMDKNEFSPAEQTLSKAEKYFLLAVSQSKAAKAKGKDNRDLQNRLKKASLKHEELVQKLISRSPKEFANGFKGSQEIILSIEKTLGASDLLMMPATTSGQTISY